MKKTIIFCACLAGLVAPASLLLYATDQLPQRTTGKILILNNDRTLQGEIDRQGDRYRVRRDMGELWLSAANVKCLCANWEEALLVMRSQINLLDAEERLRLAKWCEQNELYSQAIDEAKRAVEMRPKHPPTLQYLQALEHAAEVANRTPVVAPVKKDTTPAPALDLAADSLSLFTTKVQPVLMNACAQCHANGQGGTFKLMRTYGAGSTRQHMTQFNMAAAVRFLNLENPAISSLLIKAVSPHGNATKSPLVSRNSAPFQLLNYWVELTIANNPHLRQENLVKVHATDPAGPIVPSSLFAAPGTGKPLPMLPGSTAAPKLLPVGVMAQAEPLAPATAVNSGTTAPGVIPAEARVVNSAPSETTPKEGLTPGQGSAPSKNTPPEAREPVDEFDPIIFNQMMHPERK